MRRIGDSRVISSNPNPAGPSIAPSAKKTPIWGRSLRSMSPESSAAMIMTTPTSPKVSTKKCGLKNSMKTFLKRYERSLVGSDVK